MIRVGQHHMRIQFRIHDATYRSDHVLNSAREPLHLSGSAPLPNEILSSVVLLRPIAGDRRTAVWRDQISLMKGSTPSASPAHDCGIHYSAFDPARGRVD